MTLPALPDPAREVVLLGATGSIGTQAVDVVRAHPDRLRVVGLGAEGGRPGLLARQALELEVDVVAVTRATAVQDLQLAFYAEAQRRGYSAGRLRLPKILAGPGAMTELAAWPCDTVLNGITGSVGLAPTLAALQAGRTLALANKESLVAGGPLVTPYRDQIVPVDSEHSALAQALRGGRADQVRRLVLTASGGPFRGRSPRRPRAGDPRAGAGPPDLVDGAGDHRQLRDPGQQGPGGGGGAPAVRRRPTTRSTSWCTRSRSCTRWWSSATARRWPRPARPTCGCRSRWPWGGPTGCPARATAWTGRPRPAGTSSRSTRTPSRPSALAKEAGRRGGTAPAALNAANEECVAAFLDGRLPFLGIVDTVARVVSDHAFRERPTLAEVLDTEEQARRRARELVGSVA